MRKPTRYLDELWREAVKQVEAGRSVDDVAFELVVSCSTLFRWVKRFVSVPGGVEPGDKKALEAEVRRLQTRLEQSEMERKI
jgi:transposase-like protein